MSDLDREPAMLNAWTLLGDVQYLICPEHPLDATKPINSANRNVSDGTKGSVPGNSSFTTSAF